MASVETVRGPVDTAELGRTYMHEHVFVLTPDLQLNYPEHWGREEDRVADAVAKLKAAAAQGTRTFVDPTVVGLGRYIPRIAAIAEQVPELNLTDVLPYLREHGVTEDQIDTMLVANPRHYFENIAAY